MKNSLRTLLLAAALGSASLGAARAQTPPPAPPEAAEHADPAMIAQYRLNHLTKKLSLTADQQAALKPILLDEAKRDIHLFNELHASHVKAQGKIEAALTPAQQAKFKELIAQHEAKKEAAHAKKAKKVAAASAAPAAPAPAPATPPPAPAPEAPAAQ